MRIPVITLLLPGILLTGCHSAAPAPKPDLLTANIDSTVSPSKDFFLYANGGWMKKNPIPAAEKSWGVGELVEEDIYTRLKKINEEALSGPHRPGSTDQKIGDFWFSGMDSFAIERQKLDPLQPQLRQIEAIRSRGGLDSVFAFLHNLDMNAGFTDDVARDDKHSDVMAYFLTQGGLGMRNRDYYLNNDSTTVKVRSAYREYIRKCFLTLNADSAAARTAAGKLFDLEERLARASRSRTALRNPYDNYNKMSFGDLKKLCGAVDWARYFGLTGVGRPDSVIVGQPEYFKHLDRELRETPLGIWKSYLTFHLLRHCAGALDSVSFNNAFAYQRTLSGVPEPRPRWKRVLDAEESVMGEALGQLFVREYFTAKDKARYAQLVENIRSAFHDRIKALTWMSDSTKTKAYEKLAAVRVKVGYPDVWKDMSSLVVDRGPWVQNMLRAQAWWRARQIRKLGKPVDTTEWEMTPQTYNAYYDPTSNEMVFPAAAFFVPGYKTAELDDAFVYGYSAASTIGHELSHGFDDQGRQYDEKGNLKEWWQPADSVAFAARAGQIVRQFNQFNPIDTLHINGEATEGENIADLGGVVVGLAAFKKTETFRRNEKIGGFSPLQRFFLGYAYSWLFQERAAALSSQVMSDEHAPARERTNGPLANLPEFYEAFDIKPGSPMYRPDSVRVNIW